MNQLQSTAVQSVSVEDQLRSENESLRRQLEEQKHGHTEKKPSAWTAIVVLLLLAALAVAGYYWGYLPRQKREMVLAAESQNQSASLPVVTVSSVTRSSSTDSLVLPGNIQAVTEAPVLARASGYIKKRIADIGDRVTVGQVLAEIEAPELDQQIPRLHGLIVGHVDFCHQASGFCTQRRKIGTDICIIRFLRFAIRSPSVPVTGDQNDDGGGRKQNDAWHQPFHETSSWGCGKVRIGH